MRNTRLGKARRGWHALVVGLAFLGAASILACGSDPAGPSPSDKALATLEVAPLTADVCTPSSMNTVQLTLVPRDRTGEIMQVTDGTAEYSSSAPAIATVSDSGIVTAAAPGTAVITAVFTLGDHTRAASMSATVHESPGGLPDISGVYDLAAVVTRWDGALGLPPGSRETAVLTIERPGYTPTLTGTFADFRVFWADDESYVIGPYSGVLSGTFDCLGRVVLELGTEEQQDASWRGAGTVKDGQIVGDFSSTFIGGTFTADLVPNR
jgi:Big-like domain-containing protein